MDENKISQTEQPQTSEKNDWKKQLTTVTPLSKYLVMTFFLVLLFVVFFVWLQHQENSTNKQESSVAEEDVLDMDNDVKEKVNLSEPPQMIKNEHVEEQTHDYSNIDFEIINRNYVVSAGKLFYLTDSNISGWLKNVKTSDEFKNFILYPPEQLVSDQPLHIVIESADLTSIRILSKYDFLTDTHNIFFAGKALDGMATDTFKIIGDDGGNSAVATDGSKVFCGNNELIGADARTVKKLSNCSELGDDFSNLFCQSAYYDKNNLYYLNYSSINNGACNFVTTIDRNTFVRVATSSYYYKDRNDVYAYVNYIETLELLPLGADPKTFKLLPAGFSRDSNNLFYGRNGTWSNNLPVLFEEGDPNTFKKLNGPYVADKNQVYYGNTPHEGFISYTVVKDADPASFEVLSIGSRYSTFAKDKNAIYYDGKLLKGADSASFEVYNFDITGLAHDKNFVYIGPKKLDGISPNDVSVQGQYLISSTGVAYVAPAYEDNVPNITVLLGADNETFEVLEKMYAVDSKRGYFRDKTINGVDVKTFNELGLSYTGKYYAKDRNNLFINDEVLLLPEGGDLMSLVIVNRFFAKDNNNIYYIGGFRPSKYPPDTVIFSNEIINQWGIISNLDSDTFRVVSVKTRTGIDERYGTDGKLVYYLTTKISLADTDTFEVLDNGYSKDKARVYYYGQMIVGADTKSFIADPSNVYKGRDKNYIYTRGVRN